MWPPPMTMASYAVTRWRIATAASRLASCRPTYISRVMPIGTAFHAAHVPALREPELSRVVRLLRRQRVRDAPRARVQRDPQRRRADRHLAAVQVPASPAATPRALVDRVITRDVRELAVGQVNYTPWCDERGKVIDDGTVTRLGEQTLPLDRGRSEPALVHAERRAASTSRSRTSPSRWRRSRCRARRPAALLDAVADADIAALKYFRMTQRHDRRRAGRDLADRLHRRSRLRDLDAVGPRRRGLGRAR